MHAFIAKLAKIISGAALLTLGIGMSVDPMKSDFFSPGGRYSGPHTRHLSERDMQVMGVMFVIFGLALMFSAFKKANK